MVNRPMDVVLAYPPFINYFSGPPLGIASLAGALNDAGLDVALIDANAALVSHVRQEPRVVADLLGELTGEAKPPRTLSEQLFRHEIQCLAEDVVGLTDAHSNNAAVGDHDKDLLAAIHHQAAMLHTYHPLGLQPREPYLAEMAPEELVSLAIGMDEGVLCEWARDDWARALSQGQPQVVGFSLMHSSQVLPALHLAAVAREHAPRAAIIFGGSHITALKGKLDRLAALGRLVDVLAVHEQEVGLSRAARRFAETGRLDAFAERGMALYREGAWTGDLRRFELPMGELPSPRFDLFDLDLHQRSRRDVNIPLITAKGCTYGVCTYCTYPFHEGGPRAWSTERVVHEVRRAIAATGSRTVSFKDSLMPVDRAVTIGGALADAGVNVNWNFQTKINRTMGDGQVATLERSGCRLVEFGVETPNPRLQRLIRKKAHHDVIESVLEAFSGSSVQVIFNLIFGFPTETLEEAEASLEWADSIRDAFPEVDFATVSHMLNVPINSTLHEQMDQGELLEDWPLSATSEWLGPAWHQTFEQRLGGVYRSEGWKDGELGIGAGWDVGERLREVERLRRDRRLRFAEAVRAVDNDRPEAVSA